MTTKKSWFLVVVKLPSSLFCKSNLRCVRASHVGKRSSSSSNRGAYSSENLSNKSPEGEFDSEYSFSFFPNPTSSKVVNFTYPKGIGDLKIEAYTITGQKTNLSKVITDNSGKGTLELNLATGVYTMRFIALEDDNKTVTKKLVVL